MKVLIAVPLLLLAFAGAAGMSSMRVDGYCWDHLPTGDEGDSPVRGSGRTLLPPGWRCTYDNEGRHAELTGGSWPWFLIALAGELGVGAWYLHRRTPASTCAFAATAALAVTGAIGWYIGAWETAFWLGLFLSMPVGWIVTRGDPAAGLAAGVAVIAAGFLSLVFGAYSGDFAAGSVAGSLVAVALVAPASARLQRVSVRP